MSRVSGINFDISEVDKAGMYEAGYLLMRKQLHGLGCTRLAETASCAAPSCYEDIALDANGTQCTWLQGLHQAAVAETQRRETKLDFMWLARLGLIVLALIVLLRVIQVLRNACHQSLISSKWSGITTERCDSCQRRWVPAELSLSDLPLLSTNEVAAAVRSRGIAVDGDAAADTGTRTSTSTFARAAERDGEDEDGAAPGDEDAREDLATGGDGVVGSRALRTFSSPDETQHGDVGPCCVTLGVRRSSRYHELRRALRTALYIENISFRRPSTLITAWNTIRGARACGGEDFPLQWCAVALVFLALGGYAVLGEPSG